MSGVSPAGGSGTGENAGPDSEGLRERADEAGAEGHEKTTRKQLIWALRGS